MFAAAMALAHHLINACAKVIIRVQIAKTYFAKLLAQVMGNVILQTPWRVPKDILERSVLFPYVLEFLQHCLQFVMVKDSVLVRILVHVQILGKELKTVQVALQGLQVQIANRSFAIQ